MSALTEALAELLIAIFTAPNPRDEIEALKREAATRAAHRANQIALGVVK